MKKCNVFDSLTVFVLASEETDLLRKTVSGIISSAEKNSLKTVVIVLKSETCTSRYEAEKLTEEYADGLISVYVQKSENIRTCVAELPPMVKTSHFVIMCADMEMNPADISTFIELSKMNPDAVICAAKWLKESDIKDYGAFHKFGSRSINIFVALLYAKRVFDPFSIYQIYPKALYDSLNFGKPVDFPFEYSLIPLRLGVDYFEIPTKYRKRAHGKSGFKFKALFKMAFAYVFSAVKIRFTAKNKLVKD